MLAGKRCGAGASAVRSNESLIEDLRSKVDEAFKPGVVVDATKAVCRLATIQSVEILVRSAQAVGNDCCRKVVVATVDVALSQS